MDRKTGFTLIELLVVVVIIITLSAVTLVAVSRAGNESKDARIISSMSQIRSLAEILREEESYRALSCTVLGPDSTCANSEVEQLCEDIYSLNPRSDMKINTGQGEYCVEAGLTRGKSFCVDSQGRAVEDISGNIACDPRDYDCDAND